MANKIRLQKLKKKKKKMKFFLLMLRKSGRSTDGEMDKVRFVGPSAPATQHCLPVFFSWSATARAANLADSKFNRYAHSSNP
jgi:hypothetical protein